MRQNKRVLQGEVIMCGKCTFSPSLPPPAPPSSLSLWRYLPSNHLALGEGPVHCLYFTINKEAMPSTQGFIKDGGIPHKSVLVQTMAAAHTRFWHLYQKAFQLLSREKHPRSRSINTSQNRSTSKRKDPLKPSRCFWIWRCFPGIQHCQTCPYLLSIHVYVCAHVLRIHMCM